MQSLHLETGSLDNGVGPSLGRRFQVRKYFNTLALNIQGHARVGGGGGQKGVMKKFSYESRFLPNEVGRDLHSIPYGNVEMV